MPFTHDIKFQNRLRQYAKYLVLAVLLIGLLTLVGWEFDIEYFIRFMPKLPTMNPMAALCFIFFSISFFLITGEKTNKIQRGVGGVFAVALLGISLIKIIETIFRLNRAVDQLIFADKVAAESFNPLYAQMSPVTALCFLAAALAMLLFDRALRKKRMVAHYMALFIAFISLPSFLGYIFTVRAFYGDYTYVTMAIHAAICFIFIAVAVLFALPDRGFMRQLTASLTGSLVARRLIPIAVLIPVALGLLNLYIRLKGVSSYEFGNTVLITCLIYSLLAFIFYTTRILNKRDNESKVIEEELTETNYFLNTVLENIPDMIFVKDAQELRFFRFNKAGEELLGYSKKDLIGKNDYDFFPKDQADFFTMKDRDVIENGSMQDIPEEPIITKSGERWLHTKKIPVRDVNGIPLYLLGISEDITEKRKVQDRLKQLNADLEKKVEERTTALRALLEYMQISIEKERKYIAREIHDELGQRLTALKIDVSMCRKKILAVSEQHFFLEEMNSVISQIDQSIESVKRIAADLRPEILDHHGILEAVRWQVQKFESTTGIKCNLLHEPNDINLPPELTTAVYRIVQEALTNVARHAFASLAEIVIEQNAERVLIEIKDNGRGIDEEQAKSIKSLGLIGMKERVNLLRGSLLIKGKQGGGTILSATLPI